MMLMVVVERNCFAILFTRFNFTSCQCLYEYDMCSSDMAWWTLWNGLSLRLSLFVLAFVCSDSVRPNASHEIKYWCWRAIATKYVVATMTGYDKTAFSIKLAFRNFELIATHTQSWASLYILYHFHGEIFATEIRSNNDDRNDFDKNHWAGLKFFNFK